MIHFMWSKELIHKVDEPKIHGPLGLSYGINVLASIEGDLQLPRKKCFLDRSTKGITRDME